MKRFLPDLIAIIVFIVISVVYFSPAVFESRVLFQHDSTAGVGAGQEAKEYYERTGERTRWTNSLFGGMPTYQLSPSYDSTQPLNFIQKAYRLFLPNYVGLVFMMMLGFYILLRAMGASPFLSALGGIIWAFSSYFFILITAGHIWKFITLAYIPPTIAGIILAYRKKYLLGGAVTALFVALQIQSNHVQMTYYFLFVILFMVIAFGIKAWREKELSGFFKASSMLVVATLIGVSINLSNLYHTYEYSKETMRGKSELKQEGGDATTRTTGGLNRDYITQWSYGIGETFSLLVPNVKGGASVPLSQSDKAMEKATPVYQGLYAQLSQYFGDQPGTSGPVYVGAFVLMLFIWGAFIVKGPLKQALLGVTFLSILLSWGKNFPGLTDFFIDYVPMYNKFRAVSSILVIAEFTIPLLAILTLKEVIEKPQLLKEKIKYLYISLGLTGGIAFLFALAPRLFFSSYIPAQEMYALQQGLPKEHVAPVLANLEEIRVHLFASDAWRSFWIITIGTVLLLLHNIRKLKTVWMITAIAALCLFDMWTVNKRYLYDDQFVPSGQITEKVFLKTQTDNFILQDSSLNYRVLNLASNTFNENNTSYWHKSIGGYHAAKLRRYQEVIDRHISREMQNVYREAGSLQESPDAVNPDAFRVLNMLNTKYFVFPADEKRTATVPVKNPYAYGNAWFVGSVQYVNNADEEIDALNVIHPLQTAVIDTRFKDILKGITNIPKDTAADVRLISYEPNRLVYETSSSTDGVAVFSEIYYPGWEATVDGVPVDIVRANYILRAMNISSGKHTIEMWFKPKSLRMTESIAYGGWGVFVLMVIAGVVRKRK
ncbi:MAG: YfhO family protein [Mediterranea sp.]|nr:YfhO family protein [Mediterranea sp.]